MGLSLLFALLLLGSGSRIVCADTAFSIEKTLSLIKIRKIGSVEELLQQLPAELRSKYVLLYDSRSLQKATWKSPRVVLYSRDARFLLAFSGGDPAVDPEGFNKIEMIQWKGPKDGYEMREVAFTGGTSRPKVSEKNPETCLKCHRDQADSQKLRPIWDTYPLWPGAYHSEAEGTRPEDPEAQHYAEYLKAAPSHPRYRYLKTRDPKNHQNGSLIDNANTELSQLLGQLNQAQMLSTIEVSPYFSRYRYALLSALGNCPQSPDQLIPEAVRSQFSKTYEKSKLDTGQSIADYLRSRISRSNSLKGISEEQGIFERANSTSNYSKLRYLLKEGLGLEAGQFLFSLNRSSYDYDDSQGGLATLEEALFKKALRTDKDLRRFDMNHSSSFRFASTRNIAIYCDVLAKKSLSAAKDCAHCSQAQPVTPTPQEKLATDTQTILNKAPSSAQVKLGRGLPPVLRTCIECHTGPDPLGPTLHLEDREAFARSLSEEATTSDRTLLEELRYRFSPEALKHQQAMPPGRSLTPDEVSAILALGEGPR